MTLKLRCGEIDGMFLGSAMLFLYASALCLARRRKGAFQTGLPGQKALLARGAPQVCSRNKPVTAAAAASLWAWCARHLAVSRWRVNKLAVLSSGLRVVLTVLIIWGTWQLISLCQALGAIRWGLLIPATAAVTAILFAEALDLEAAAAERAVRGAVFTADRWGGRAETVRSHAQEYVRNHGRCPEGTHVLHDIYTGRPFTVVYRDTDRPR
jgi:hypothetical protein